MRAYLGLGSNLGNRKSNLLKALMLINRMDWTKISRVSSVYINPAEGWSGGDFFNAVCEVNTLLSPEELLVRTRHIEGQLGRSNKYDNSARNIDIDILLCDNRKIDLPDLVVPHPRMYERDFVLAPLCEICPGAFCDRLQMIKQRGVLCAW